MSHRAHCSRTPGAAGTPARGREARGPFVRPERAPRRRAVAGTGRVHTAPERGQWRPARSTSPKSSSFAIQPLSPRLSRKLPTLISGGWRGRKPAEARARRVRGALGGSPPPSGRSRGDAASCTLTRLDGPRGFVSVTRGEGCSLTPARGGGGGRSGGGGASPESSPHSGGAGARGDGRQLFPEPAPVAVPRAPVPPSPTGARGRHCRLGPTRPEGRGALARGPCLPPGPPLVLPLPLRPSPSPPSLSPASK